MITLLEFSSIITEMSYKSIEFYNVLWITYISGNNNNAWHRNVFGM